MKKYLRSAVLCLFVGLLCIMSGCSKDKAEENKKTEVSLVENAVYDSPKNATQEQIKVFNELSKALNSNADKSKVAELVAVNFAYEFFSLYQKSGKEDIGGLTFLPKDEVKDFKEYAIYHYYNNYATVVSQYSKDDLPNVIMHEVGTVEPAEVTYYEKTYEGYEVSLVLKYADSKLPADGMKTNMTIQVINMDGVYRVNALEYPQEA